MLRLPVRTTCSAAACGGRCADCEWRRSEPLRRLQARSVLPRAAPTAAAAALATHHHSLPNHTHPSAAYAVSLPPLPLTVASVAALGLGLRCLARPVARVDDLRLADHKAILDELPDVLPCSARARGRGSSSTPGRHTTATRAPRSAPGGLHTPRASPEPLQRQLRRVQCIDPGAHRSTRTPFRPSAASKTLATAPATPPDGVEGQQARMPGTQSRLLRTAAVPCRAPSPATEATEAFYTSITHWSWPGRSR